MSEEKGSVAVANKIDKGQLIDFFREVSRGVKVLQSAKERLPDNRLNNANLAQLQALQNQQNDEDKPDDFYSKVEALRQNEYQQLESMKNDAKKLTDEDREAKRKARGDNKEQRSSSPALPSSRTKVEGSESENSLGEES